MNLKLRGSGILSLTSLTVTRFDVKYLHEFNRFKNISWYKFVANNVKKNNTVLKMKLVVKIVSKTNLKSGASNQTSAPPLKNDTCYIYQWHIRSRNVVSL